MDTKKVRSKIARTIGQTKLPGAPESKLNQLKFGLSGLVRTREANAELEAGARNIVQGMIAREEIAKRVAQQPGVAWWYTPQAMKRVFAGIGAEQAVNCGLALMTDIADDAEIATFFAKYVSSDETFKAVILAANKLIGKMVEWGYMIEYPDRPPESNMKDGDWVIYHGRALGWIAHNLCQANRTLDYDAVYKDMVKNIFPLTE